MTRAIVNIVTSDRGWILERLASELAARLAYVTYTETADPAAAAFYAMPYTLWRRRSSPIEIAYFTHLERDPGMRDHFFAVARQVDHCVCHSRLHEDALRQAGIGHVTTISPGVDLERFTPKVKIGVVGRTYHTGRKGEHLVARVMDVDGIEWHFTGEGWPGPARFVPDEALPAFYNDMDYILVPSLYEGGPMCVVEALACGTPVIAPPVGWVGEFPHVEFETGNVADLRRVLQDVVSERRRLRATVLDRTWDRWAEGHDRLFRTLLRAAGIAPDPVTGPFKRPETIGLVLHGTEPTMRGGPTVRTTGMAAELRRRGHVVHTTTSGPRALGPCDVVHGFNVWPPDSALAMVRSVRSVGKPFVFSPVYLDLSTIHLWEREIPRVVTGTADVRAIDGRLAEIVARGGNVRACEPAEPSPGCHAGVRAMIAAADHVVLLSDHERRCLEAIGARPRVATLIRNPVDWRRFRDADPTRFVSTFGIEDFVLCVARVEPRKNQLLLLHALRDTGLPIVLIGDAADASYARALARYLGPKVRLLGRIEPGSDLVPSAYAACRAAVLPSFAEGAALAALEAAAAGAPLVLGDRASGFEVFGDLVRYCDPFDPGSIRNAVLEAYETAPHRSSRSTLTDRIAREHGWQRHIDATLDVYRRTAETFAPGSPPADVDVAVPPRSTAEPAGRSGWRRGRWPWRRSPPASTR